MLKRLATILALAAVLAGCASITRFDAGGDVHAFLVSIRDDDRATFEAHVDRPALRAQLQARLLAAAQQHGGDLAAAGVMLARPLIEAMADQMVQPEVFLAVAQLLGYSPDTPVPNRLVVASALRPIDPDHVCVPQKKGGPCLLVFRNEAGTWRLVAFEGETRLLKP